MNLLLDTCTFLWLVSDPTRLSAVALSHITDPAHSCHLSSVSAWEIGVLWGLGRITSVDPPEVFVPKERANHRLNALPLIEEAALHVSHIPPIHRDPFDRMLICQAIVHQMVLVTPDPQIRKYPAVQVVW